MKKLLKEVRFPEGFFKVTKPIIIPLKDPQNTSRVFNPGDIVRFDSLDKVFQTYDLQTGEPKDVSVPYRIIVDPNVYSYIKDRTKRLSVEELKNLTGEETIEFITQVKKFDTMVDKYGLEPSTKIKAVVLEVLKYATLEYLKENKQS